MTLLFIIVGLLAALGVGVISVWLAGYIGWLPVVLLWIIIALVLIILYVLHGFANAFTRK